MRGFRNCLLAGSLFLCALGGPALALPGDQQKPIRIEAAEALRDENQGYTEYKGKVVLDQGSLHIEADVLTVYHTGKDASRITARGGPATLRQQPELDRGEITAQAKQIEYYRDEARVELRNEASIEQEGAIVTGDRIDYFINEKLVKADSDGSTDGSRVQVVIPAQVTQQLQDEQNAGAPEPADPNTPAASANSTTQEAVDGAPDGT